MRSATSGVEIVATWQVSDLIAQLEPDPWRIANPFSPELAECHQALFDAARSREYKIGALSGWLAQHQPCLFGQMEAKQKRLEFCVLTENDLERSDQEIRARIQRERTAWKRTALAGKSHGFLIVAVSERIATARPNQLLHNLAKGICAHYLGVYESDEIHLDDVILEIKDQDRTEWRKWKVGVNYFSAQGDGRWWQDHRIPGGLAFSMNSVGHMARTLAERQLTKNAAAAICPAEIGREKLVYWALPKAMRTIGPPADGSTRGTWLARRGTFSEDREPPTFEQRQQYFGDLAQFSENRYLGLYHTDETIPSLYFDERVQRREDLSVREDLFFTYLHSLTDEDYLAMGLGKEFQPETDEISVSEFESGSEP
jgi:hypothetical protein